MGKICLSHRSALEAWRRYRIRRSSDDAVLFGPNAPDPKRDFPSVVFQSVPLSACSIEEVAECAKEIQRVKHEDAPVDLLVPRDSRRRVVEGAVLHSIETPLPSKSLLSISEGLCLVSPEFCFVQMAQILSVGELARIAFEFCGCYVLDESRDRGMRRCQPLTSRERLLAFIEKMPPLRGLPKARIVAGLVADRCASPREAALFALLCFPVKEGGFGIPVAQVNKEIALSKRSSRVFGSSFYVGDLVWPEAKVIVEYDGLLDHAARGRIARDAGRRDALVAEGYTVFVVTDRQISDATLFQGIAKAVARRIGYKLRIRDTAFEQRSVRLRATFLGK